MPQSATQRQTKEQSRAVPQDTSWWTPARRVTRRGIFLAAEWFLPWVAPLVLLSALLGGPVHTTCSGLVIQPLDPSWATVRIWTDAPVIETGPGINRDCWEYLTPQPYELSSAASLTVAGNCTVYYWQDGVGSSRYVYGGVADYNADGDAGTDLDIEAFFACLAGECCPACDPDFDGDGDPGTDMDIHAFFRALGGGQC